MQDNYEPGALMTGLMADDAPEEEIVVRTKWATPNADAEIGHIARVSNPSASLGDPSSKLIAFLLRKQHWSPFQMANLCLEVHTTRDISAQILRHASFGFQEFSTRYADVEELESYKECRFQDDKNRQNSWTPEQMAINHGMPFDEIYINGHAVIDSAIWWNQKVVEVANGSIDLYQEARARGIAKEVARCILPIGLCPTTMYINGTIRSWIHYVALRSEMGTQKEHRAIAEGAYGEMQLHLPDTTAAFDIWSRTNRIKEFLYTLILNADDQGTVDLMADAMQDIHDMDTNTTDFAKAALAALVREVESNVK